MASFKTCGLHVATDLPDGEKLIESSEISIGRIANFIQQWINLDGIEQIVASDLDNLMKDGETHTVYYHRKCYMRFTDKTRVQKAKQRLDREKPEEENNFKQKRLNRSTCRSYASLFPNKCIICEKDHYVYQYDRKRKKESIVLCQTYNASDALLKAATLKSDEALLCKIRDVDCIAKELKYHRSCFLAYTRLLKKKYTAENSDSNPYYVHYKTFCETVIESKIISNCEILRMNKLNESLMDIIIKNEPELLDQHHSISNRQLKRWLIKDYPQLIFVKPKQRNLSELVLCSSNSQSAITIINGNSTDTPTSEVDSIEITPTAYHIEDKERHNLYKSALYLKKIISESPPINCIWPPTAEDLNDSNVMDMIPVLLFNFLAWCSGDSDEVEMNNFAQIPESKKIKIQSIAQDIIYFSSKGRKPTPKHYSLAMSIRHITGSAKLTNLINRFGHCISHTAVLEYDTALAEMQLDLCNNLPMTIEKKQFTTVVWDNIDFHEETQSGHETTHHTNGIIIQKNNSATIVNIPKKGLKSGKRTFHPPAANNVNYYAKKKPGILNDYVLSTVQNTEQPYLAKKIDSIYILSKLFLNSDIFPGWTGFNIKMCPNNIPLSTIKYLPVIEANPTEMSTIYTILLKSIEIADKLEIDSLVLVSDQAIYSKIQQIRWNNDIFNQRLVVRLGEFHTVMTFLGIIGKRFKDAGLVNIMIESEIVAAGSVDGVISGKHYNRSLRTHKFLFEAFSRMLWSAFLQSMTEEFCSEVYSLSKHLCKLYFDGNLNISTVPTNFTDVMDLYDEFILTNCERNPTFFFWFTYLEIVSCLLRFIRATRTGDWKLHLKTVEEMIPWFFAYDKVNYSRYLPVYFLEMVNLELTHPDIYANMLSGGFVAQRQIDFSFSGIAFDQVIEQTANRDSKTKGGLIGLTRNPGAVHRWMLSHHLRAQISASCEQLSGKKCETKIKNDLCEAQIRKEEKSIQCIISSVDSMVNPFTYEEGGLVNIASGVLASENVQRHLETAQDIGKKCYEEYQHKIHNKEDIFTPIKKNNLLTFSSTIKEKNKLQAAKNFKISTKLLIHLITSGQSSTVNMNEVMSFNLSNFPPAISNEDGTLAKTNKAALIHNILSSVEHVTSLDDVSGKKVLIIDGMAFLQQLKCTAASFGKFAIYSLEKLINLAIYHHVITIHFVTDTYPENSIKNCERNRRKGKEDAAVIRIINSEQRMPNQFKKFLSVGKNKENLVEFLFEQWSKTESCIFQSINIIITHKNMCHKLTPLENKIECSEIIELNSNQEEADTKMLLHAFYASKFADSILIKCCDTDVIVLCIGMCNFITSNIYVLPGISTYPTVVDVSSIYNKLGHNISSALIGLHCFTGCDSCSSFKGKGKIKAFKLMQNNPSYITAFQKIGSTFNVSLDIIEMLEIFTCELYGQPKCKRVNDARELLFKTKLDVGISLPPNQDSLTLHIKRSNYQACILKKCNENYIKAPSPTEHGWIFQNDILEIHWSSIPPLPDFLIKQAACNCKKTACLTNKCSCKLRNLSCSDMCKCNDHCGNKIQESINVDGDIDSRECSESDYDSESLTDSLEEV